MIFSVSSASAGPSVIRSSPPTRTCVRLASATVRWARCSTSRIVVPTSRISVNALKIPSTASGARPRDGSSRSRMSGRETSARPIASCCCWPPESAPACRPRNSLRIGKSSKAGPNGSPMYVRRRAARPRRRFSSTVKSPKIRRPSGTRAMPARAIDSTERRRSACPFSLISPRWAGCRPMIALSVVDFPAPFGPIRPTISPLPTRSVRSRTAETLPYRTSTPASSSAAASGIGLHRGLAEIGRSEVQVDSNLRGRSGREGSALVEHVDPVADTHHERHVVVDQQHTGSMVVANRANNLRKLGHLCLRQASGRLVHQHERGLGDERARHPQPPFVALGQRAGPCIGQIRQTQKLEQLPGPPPRLAGAHTDPERGDLDVLADGEGPQRAAVLERARQAGARPSMSAPAGDVAIAELDRARVRQVEAGEHVHERRLAGAVRPDQTDDLPRVELERDLLQRLDACEGTANGGGPKGFFGPPLDPASRRRISQLQRLDDLCPHQALEAGLVVLDLDHAVVAPVDGV